MGVQYDIAVPGFIQRDCMQELGGRLAQSLLDEHRTQTPPVHVSSGVQISMPMQAPAAQVPTPHAPGKEAAQLVPVGA